MAVERGVIRFIATLAGTLTFLSLTLAGIGIYGVASFCVNRRTREIGIRVSLGATSRMVLWNVAIEALRPVLAGIGIGLLPAEALVVLSRSAIEPVPGSILRILFFDPAIYLEIAAMVAFAAIASLLPARRALRVDPAAALRHE